MQEEDLTVDGAMTDPKGDRGLPPCRQEDPDMYVRVVERQKDGIVVRGAKAHQTGALNSHWVLVMPTIAMSKDDADYAVSFACPGRCRRDLLHLWTPVLRYPKTRRRQHGCRQFAVWRP